MKINKDTEDLSIVEKKLKSLRETAKNDSLITMGAMKASEELFEKHKALLISTREEMVSEIQKNGLSQESANYSLKQLDKVTQMIKKFSKDRLQHYYAKIGAMNAIEGCVKILELQQEEAKKRSEQQVQESEIIKEFSEIDNESSNLVSKNENNAKNFSPKANRPDDENTKMGKKLKNIRSRPRKDKI